MEIHAFRRKEFNFVSLSTFKLKEFDSFFSTVLHKTRNKSSHVQFPLDFRFTWLCIFTPRCVPCTYVHQKFDFLIFVAFQFFNCLFEFFIATCNAGLRNFCANKFQTKRGKKKKMYAKLFPRLPRSQGK